MHGLTMMVLLHTLQMPEIAFDGRISAWRTCAPFPNVKTEVQGVLLCRQRSQSPPWTCVAVSESIRHASMSPTA